MSDPELIETRLAAYLTHRMPAVQAVAISDFARIHGGGSQEMFRFRASWSEGGEVIERPMILRREPPAGMVEAERDLEYKTYRALAQTTLPLPRGPRRVAGVCVLHGGSLGSRWRRGARRRRRRRRPSCPS